jgi:hypothetical protein
MSERTESGPLKLPRLRRYTLYGVCMGVWLTGAVWLIYHYFLRTQGRFGLVNNPLEVWWLRLHAAFSFWAIWMFGLLWGIHIVRGWNANWRRWSGGTVVGFAAVLILTGYGLYYITGESWRSWTSLTHWILGLAALAVFFVHWLSKSMPRRTATRGN